MPIYTGMDKWQIASQFLSNSPDLFLILDGKGMVRFASRAFQRELGWNPRDLLSKPLWNLIHADDLKLAQREFINLAEQNQSLRGLQIRVANNLNDYLWIEWNGFVEDSTGSIYITGRNFTQRKEVELKENAFMRETQKIARIGGWRIDLPGNELFWSDEIYILHDLPIGHPITVEEAIDFYAPSSRSIIADCVQRAISRGTGFDEELEIYTAKGKRLWVRAKGSATYRNDEIVSVQGIFQDITEITDLKRAQEATIRQVTRIAENFPGILFQMSQDRAGVICFPFISERIFEMTGVTVAEVVTDPEKFFRRIPLTDRSRLFAQIKRSSETNTPFEWEGRIRTTGEEEVWLMVRSQPESGSKDETFSWDGIILDISDNKKIQQELESQRMASIQGAKMASLGEMAGGIAHEVNNPLAIINGMASQLKYLVNRKSLDDTDKLLHYIGKIEATTKRIADIVRGLRAFSRNADHDPFDRAKLSTVIKDAIELGKERMRYHAIELKVNVDPSIEVECRAGQIIQVFVNLLSNSFYAIKDLEDKWISIKAQVEGNTVTVEFQDSGRGIPKDVQERIMEPFFTTKEVGVGTGLGLSISKGIVADHSGEFRYVDSEKHTTFLIRMPLSQTGEKSLPKAS